MAGGHAERPRSVVVQARDRDGQDRTGLGVTATKKVGGAVIRNRAKRRLREASATLLPVLGLPGTDYVLIARQETGSIPWTSLLDDVESALISLRRKIQSGQPPEPARGRPRRGSAGKCRN